MSKKYLNDDIEARTLYKWEDQYIRNRLGRKVSLQEARKIIKSIFDNRKFCKTKIDFRFLEVDILELPYRTKTYGTADLYTIKLDRYVPLFVVLHELAHSITMTYNVDENHGALFLGIYLKIIAAYLGINKNIMINIGCRSKFEITRMAW